MIKTTIWALVMSLALTTASFAATDEEKCQQKKLLALGKRSLCLQKEQSKGVLGKSTNLAACTEKFARAIAKANEAAAKKDASCRWLDNGDGTATDLHTGLQWEIKTDDDSVHDKDNLYPWCKLDEFFFCETNPFYYPDGEVFTEFLATLNGNIPAAPSPPVSCFADKCDWRIPTVEELQSIMSEPPPCLTATCTTIPGETATFTATWSVSSRSALDVWQVYFTMGGGYSGANNKASPFHVRAVRTP